VHHYSQSFYYPTNTLNYTKLKRLKSTLYKSLKGTKLKITPTCFGSYVMHNQAVQSCAWLKFLVVVHRYFFVCLVGVWQCNFEPGVCVCVCVCVYGTAGPYTHTHTPQDQNYAAKYRPSTRKNICEALRGISVKHNSVLPDDGSHKNRNMSQWFLILCPWSFYTT
jgi:hypothetical protein